MIYATIDANNICNGIKEVSGVIDALDHIEVETYDDTLIGKKWNDTTFEGIVIVLSFDELQENLIQATKAKFQTIVDTANNKRTAYELDTFRTQEQEYRNYISDNTASTPFLDSLSTARGITKLELIAKIEGSLSDYATILGQQQLAIDDIMACVTLEDLVAIEQGVV